MKGWLKVKTRGDWRFCLWLAAAMALGFAVMWALTSFYPLRAA